MSKLCSECGQSTHSDRLKYSSDVSQQNNAIICHKFHEVLSMVLRWEPRPKPINASQLQNILQEIY